MFGRNVEDLFGLQWQTLPELLRLYSGRLDFMISLQWDLGVDRMHGILPRVTGSGVSTAMIMLQDAAFVCAFTWFVSPHSVGG